MSTYDMPVSRRGWYTDGEGILTYVKRADETKTYTIDFTDALDSGETVSSVATDVSGVTLNSTTVSSPTVALSVSETDGSIMVTATTSASRVLEVLIRFRNKYTGSGTNDYRYST